MRRDKEFLVFSPSSYNAVGLGTTQLYNRTLVYNHKRHGVFRLGNRQFDFRVKPRFPKKLSREFLYVDLLNNLEELAEDRAHVRGELAGGMRLPSLDPRCGSRTVVRCHVRCHIRPHIRRCESRCAAGHRYRQSGRNNNSERPDPRRSPAFAVGKN